MTNLIYSPIMSLDGYIEDETGSFDWAVPSEEAHRFINDLMRPVGTYLFGRRMYEIMMGWETDPSLADDSPVMADFAQIWQSADKIVYSRTLQSVSTSRTRLVRNFEPDEVTGMKRELESNIAIGGPELAAEAFRSDLVDECHVFLAPITVGKGKPAFPTDSHINLELLDRKNFTGGMTYLRFSIER